MHVMAFLLLELLLSTFCFVFLRSTVFGALAPKKASHSTASFHAKAVSRTQRGMFGGCFFERRLKADLNSCNASNQLNLRVGGGTGDDDDDTPLNREMCEHLHKSTHMQTRVNPSEGKWASGKGQQHGLRRQP